MQVSLTSIYSEASLIYPGCLWLISTTQAASGLKREKKYPPKVRYWFKARAKAAIALVTSDYQGPATRTLVALKPREKAGKEAMFGISLCSRAKRLAPYWSTYSAKASSGSKPKASGNGCVSKGHPCPSQVSDRSFWKDETSAR